MILRPDGTSMRLPWRDLTGRHMASCLCAHIPLFFHVPILLLAFDLGCSYQNQLMKGQDDDILGLQGAGPPGLWPPEPSLVRITNIR